MRTSHDRWVSVVWLVFAAACGGEESRGDAGTEAGRGGGDSGEGGRGEAGRAAGRGGGGGRAGGGEGGGGEGGAGEAGAGQGGEGEAGAGQGGEGGGPECSGEADCDDSDACTTDRCEAGACEHASIDCSDGVYCNGAETCDSQVGCEDGSPVDPDDGVACTDDVCDEDNDVVINAVNDGLCDDGVACTDDACDAVDGCTFTPNNALCDDGVDCTDDDCDAAGGCTFTANDALCDDGVDCTDDDCDAVAGCGFTANDANCSDGVDCTDGNCDANDDCTFSANDALCDDGVDCTDDACNMVSDCTFTPNDALCDDGVDCTDDNCDAVDDCTFSANDALCDDGVDCTDDACDPIDGCGFTANDANCDDGVGCTDDACDAVDDCSFTPNDANCVDPAGCLVPTCDAVTGCGGIPDNSQCNDADACTTDVCDPADDCRNYATSAVCGDLIISEIMQNPGAVDDVNGEWFEITNTGPYDFNLAGCTIEDDGIDSHVIASDLIVSEADRVTLARSAAPGFVPRYVYSGIELDDALDELVITCGGQELARVQWDDGVLFPDPAGASMTLHANAFTGARSLWGRNWCQGTSAYGTGGDLGTPGAVNDPCPTVYVIDLTSAQEVPPTGVSELGACTLTLNAAQTQLAVSCTHNVAGANAAHIHLGAVGVNGGVVFSLGNGLSPIVTVWSLTAADLANLLAGALYVNVHSASFQGGAIRGQIVPATLLTHSITGAQELPPVVTSASGVCVHALPFGRSFFDAWCTHSAVSTTAAHIHNAPLGMNGAILVGFASPTSPIVQRLPTDATFLTELAAGNLYLNVHTTANPGGELRGQIPSP